MFLLLLTMPWRMKWKRLRLLHIRLVWSTIPRWMKWQKLLTIVSKWMHEDGERKGCNKVSVGNPVKGSLAIVAPCGSCEHHELVTGDVRVSTQFKRRGWGEEENNVPSSSWLIWLTQELSLPIEKHRCRDNYNCWDIWQNVRPNKC